MTDVERIDARLRFDVASGVADAVAALDLLVDAPGGPLGVDLRQEVATLLVDDVAVVGGDFPPEVGAGRHRLEVTYTLDTPDAEDARPVDWRGDGVRLDFWMSDLAGGRYLEQWVPAPLCGDRFELALDVEVAAGRPHAVVTNAVAQEAAGPNRWQLRWGPGTTSLSPMVAVAPADEVVWWDGVAAGGLGVRVARYVEVDADEAACGADVAAWLAYLSARYGPWAHPTSTFTALVWDSGRGMEYDGATTSSVRALEHEVFHSWFGRGVKPATPSDGWIDEAFTSWATASSRNSLPRFAVLSVDEALSAVDSPVALYPQDPSNRRTPRESYSQGAVVFAGVAGALGGAERLREAMGAWYRAHAGGLVTTAGLRAALEGWAGVDLGMLWEPLVHGR